MPPASAPRGSPLEVAKFKRNRPASAGAPRRAPSDTRLLRQRPAFGDSQGRATPAPTQTDLGRCGYCCLRHAGASAAPVARAGLRRVGTRLLQFAPELDGAQLLNYVCDYARSDAHAHLLNQCLRLDPAGCAGCAPEDAGDALQFARAELESELMRQTDRLQRESGHAHRELERALGAKRAAELDAKLERERLAARVAELEHARAELEERLFACERKAAQRARDAEAERLRADEAASRERAAREENGTLRVQLAREAEINALLRGEIAKLVDVQHEHVHTWQEANHRLLTQQLEHEKAQQAEKIATLEARNRELEKADVGGACPVCGFSWLEDDDPALDRRKAKERSQGQLSMRATAEAIGAVIEAKAAADAQVDDARRNAAPGSERARAPRAPLRSFVATTMDAAHGEGTRASREARAKLLKSVKQYAPVSARVELFALALGLTNEAAACDCLGDAYTQLHARLFDAASAPGAVVAALGAGLGRERVSAARAAQAVLGGADAARADEATWSCAAVEARVATPADVRELLDQIDALAPAGAPGDGVSVDALAQLVMAWLVERVEAHLASLERAFATFDVDGSGTIDRIEFEDLIRYCAGTIRLSDERVAELWDEMNALEGDDEARADDAQSIAMPHAFAIVCHRYGLYVSTHTPPPDA